MADEPNLEIEYIDVAELIPYARNSKKHDDDQVQTIINSIERFRMCDPIGVWTNPQGELEIVEGHGRVLALSSIGEEKAPVIRLDHLSDEERRAYSHIHNKTTMNSGFDEDMLSLDMDELDFEWEDFGFDIPEDEPEKRGSTEGAEEIDLDEYDDDKFEHECPKCGFRFNDGKTGDGAGDGIS